MHRHLILFTTIHFLGCGENTIFTINTAYIQLSATMISIAGIYEQRTIQRSGNIHYSFST
jgi:hypothetical protein